MIMSQTQTIYGSSSFGVIGRVTPRYGETGNEQAMNHAAGVSAGNALPRILSTLGAALPWRQGAQSHPD
jgi:hypothetical protein